MAFRLDFRIRDFFAIRIKVLFAHRAMLVGNVAFFGASGFDAGDILK